MLVFINLKKNLQIFMKLSFMGAMCATILIVYIFYQGIKSLTDPESHMEIITSGVTPEGDDRPETAQIFMFSSGVANLAGVLCAGYFLH